MFKYSTILITCFNLSNVVNGQLDSQSVSKIYKHINILASDSLRGRGNFSEGLLKAANYISVEFSKSNLQPLAGFFDYYIPFNGGSFKSITRDKLVWNEKSVQKEHYFYFTTEKLPERKSLKDFRLVELNEKLPDSILFHFWNETDNILIWWNNDNPGNSEAAINKLLVPDILPFSNVLIVAVGEKPVTMEIGTDALYRENILFNLAGVLKGKKDPSEIIIFSAHYDHVGVNRQLRPDSIFNGANDNASGVAALLALAEYYSEKNDNERTLLFCAFAGEEIGLRGSYDLAEILKPSAVKAMLNFEMLGKNSTGILGKFFITGETLSDLKNILLKELNKTGVSIADEPSVYSLFNRSDNFPFALKGVPAHSIMSSYDIDPCYHKPCDEISAMNPLNIAVVVKNIITGCTRIITGKETPKRVKIGN